MFQQGDDYHRKHDLEKLEEVFREKVRSRAKEKIGIAKIIE